MFNFLPGTEAQALELIGKLFVTSPPHLILLFCT